MSKHTPGPWYVAPSLNEIVNADHGFLRYDIRADCLLIGALYENEADARLIAAAPDLLEKCIKVSSWLNRLADAAEQLAKESERFPSLADANRADAMNYRRTAEDIQLVIAKATGDSND